MGTKEPFAKFGVGHEMGAECSCKITPSKGICTWLAMGFPLGALHRDPTQPGERWEHLPQDPARILVKALLQRQSAGEPTNPVKPIATTLPGLVRAGRPRSQGQQLFPTIRSRFLANFAKGSKDYVSLTRLSA